MASPAIDNCQTMYPRLHKMASSVSTVITDSRLTDLLPEIFLRLPTPADLISTSATCKSFHKLISDHSYLRHFRKLHTQSLLGFLDDDGFQPVDPPHPCAPAARATVLAANFSFSFLPPPACWKVKDLRDGRVLLDRRFAGEQLCPIFSELAVSDPLNQRYILLPPIPDDLVRSVEDPLCVLSEPFLASHGMEELDVPEEEVSFRVFWLASYQTKVVAFVFASSTRKWCVAASHVWRDLLVSKVVLFTTSGRPMLSKRHYAYGCFYWKINFSNMFLVLNTQRMEFSTINHPSRNVSCTIVEAGEGRLGMLSFQENRSNFCYRVRQNKSENSTTNKWKMEKEISLGSRYQHFVTGATERYVILVGEEDQSYASSSLERPYYEYFILDVKTMQLGRMYRKKVTKSGISRTHIYTNFPPSLLSSRTI